MRRCLAPDAAVRDIPFLPAVRDIPWGSYWGRSCLTSRLRTSPTTTSSPTARPKFCVWSCWANRTKRSLTSYSLPWAPSKPTSTTSWSKPSSKTARRSSCIFGSDNLPKRDRFILVGFIWANVKAAARELLSLAAVFWLTLSFVSICNIWRPNRRLTVTDRDELQNARRIISICNR